MLAAVAAAEARDFPLKRQSVGEMDLWIESVAERWGVDGQLLFRARVCVSELAANVVEHGQVQFAAASMHLELRHKLPALEIEISDPGIAFDPVAAPPIEHDNERVGGRGLRLVRAYAHGWSYSRVQDRNVITLQLRPRLG